MDREVETKTGEMIFVIAFIIAICGLGLVVISRFADSFYASPAQIERMLVARVKGSIYEQGEAISVFGTCVDSYDVPVANSTGTLSAWYPNGTQFIFAENMTVLQTGYFLWTGIMSNTRGTYLTEFICNATLGGYAQTAKAWGEWQNPFWVERLANISADVSNLSDQIAVGFNNTIANITFLRENMTNNFNYTNQLILDTQVIANASVDRNNSLLAYLLYQLLNQTARGDVSWDEYEVDASVYWRDWSIKVKAYDKYGAIVGSPEVACTINSTQDPAPQYMVVEGNHFESNIFIFSWEFAWQTNCFYTT